MPKGNPKGWIGCCPGTVWFRLEVICIVKSWSGRCLVADWFRLEVICIVKSWSGRCPAADWIRLEAVGIIKSWQLELGARQNLRQMREEARREATRSRQ